MVSAKRRQTAIRSVDCISYRSDGFFASFFANFQSSFYVGISGKHLLFHRESFSIKLSYSIDPENIIDPIVTHEPVIQKKHGSGSRSLFYKILNWYLSFVFLLLFSLFQGKKNTISLLSSAINHWLYFTIPSCILPWNHRKYSY